MKSPVASLIAFFTVGWLASAVALADPGDLDLSFNATGKIQTSVGLNEFKVIATDSQHRIIAAGHGLGTVQVARFLPNGTPDPAFNGTGWASYAAGNQGSETVTALTIGSDDSIYLTGSAGVNFAHVDVPVVHISANGTLDMGFGTGGIQLFNFNRFDEGCGIAIDANGGIVVAGRSGDNSGDLANFAIARFGSTGIADPAFGTGGKTLTPLAEAQIPRAMVMHDGKFLVVGATQDGSEFDIILLRYTAGGVLDTSFNASGTTPGIVITDVSNGPDMANAVQVLADGKILVAGQASNGADMDVLLARYTDAGILDTSFNPTGAMPGVLLVDAGSGHDTGDGLAVTAAGKIFVVATVNDGTAENSDFVTLCFDSEGEPDTSFGVNGRVEAALRSSSEITTVSGNPRGKCLHLQADGNLLVGGAFDEGMPVQNAVLFRYTGLPVPSLVPGSANLWLAGQPGGTARYTDFAPAASPVEVIPTITPGQDVIFTVTGGTHNGPPAGPITIGPDGGADATHETENGIAELKAPLNSLVGVFLTGDAPGGSPQPYQDFNVPANREYDNITPGIQQPFFIGDGRKTDDTVQRVRIPAGATRLFLGSLDEYDNATNSGSFEVIVHVVAPLPEVPQPTLPLITQPSQNWEFSVKQPDLPGLNLRVQTTLASDPNGWTDLPGGGEMTLGADDLWTLTLAELPLGRRNFRIVQTADGHATTVFNFSQTIHVSSPAGQILYTRGSFGSSQLVLMEADGSDKTVLTDNSVSPLRCALSPNGQMVAFTTLSGELFVMKAELMNGTTNIPVDILQDSGSDVHFNAVPAWSADGIHIAYADSSSHIQVIAALENGAPLPFDASTNPLYDVFTSLSGEPNLAWSPNGKHLIVTEGSILQAYQVMDATGEIIPNAAGSVVTLTLPTDFSTQKPSVAWSPDGTQIAFVEEKPGTGESRVALLTVDNGAGGLLPESATNARVSLVLNEMGQPAFATANKPQSVSWSPDGTLLAIETLDGGNRRIDVVKPEAINDTTNAPVALTQPGSGGDAYQPVFRQPLSQLAIAQLVAFQSPVYAGNEEDEEPTLVRVTRSGLTDGELEVAFQVTGGTATEGLDYTISDSPLVFADGETEKIITVTPLPDAEDQEGDENLVIALVASPDVELGGSGTTTMTINDTDSNQQPFTPACLEFTVAVNGKLLKTGTGKTGDTLSFKARQEQGWDLAGLQVKVQYTTTPQNAGSWLNLPEPLLSRSTNTSLTWVGNTKKFPVGKLYFRTRSYALKHRSNAGPVVGPFTISAAPVLELTMTVDTDSDPTGLTVKPSEFINYRIKCKNIGTATATKVLLNSRLPNQSTRFDSASHAIAPYFKLVKDNKGVTTDVQWNVGNINAGAEVNEFLTVQVNSVEQIDYNRLIQNDRLTYKIGTAKEVFMPIFRTIVNPPIKVTIAKDKSIVVAGDLITYTLTARNEASYTINGGKVNDQVPTGTRLISVNYGNGSGNYLGTPVAANTLTAAPIGLSEPGLTPHNGMLTWNIGDVGPGGIRQVRFTVRVAYDLFEKISRNGEDFNVQIQNLNFDFTGSPAGAGGTIAARGGYIPYAEIARTFVSAEPPTLRPEIGLQKLAVSDTLTKLGSSDIAGIFFNGRRGIEYDLETWNYGTAPAEETVIYDGVPFETEINADNGVVGHGATGTFTSEVPHQLVVGQKVKFTYLSDGNGTGPLPAAVPGLAVNTIYYVKTVLTATQFILSKTATGPAMTFTNNVTAGYLRRFVYDSDAFMRKFSLNGTPLNSSAGFHFFDVNGKELLPGGEVFIDRNNDGLISTAGKKDLADFNAGKSEFVDMNGNKVYDGPEAIRTFSYRMGTLSPMTAPAKTRLSYRVQLGSKVARGEYVAALNSAVHKKGAGLELTCPDFYYPVIGSPPMEFAKVVAKLDFAMHRPRARDNGFIGGAGGVLQITYDISFTNKGDFFANNTQLRIPIQAGFTTTSGRQPLDKRNATYDVLLTGSPGTAVFDIGEVAPGETVTRQLVLNMTHPIPPALFVAGLLKNYDALIAPCVFATKATATSISAPPPAGKKAGVAPPPVVLTQTADGRFFISTPVQPTKLSTRVFIGRVSHASVQEGNECDFFIFFGNMGDEISGSGEVAMQVPYGTRFVSADPLSYNPLEGDNNQTGNFPPNYFKIDPIPGKRRLEDGKIDVVRWKFANIAPASIYCVKLTVFVNENFPSSSISDKSAYISVKNATSRSASPITVKVRKDSSGAVDWWQGVNDMMQGLGNFVDDSLRHLFGDFTKQVAFDSNVVGIGGADLVQMDNGTLVIPLGRSRSVIIGPHNLVFGKVPAKSLMIQGDSQGGIAMAAGVTSNQQVLVGGSRNAFQSVQLILNELPTVNSIVAAGGGNIVAAGGGNIVAAGGGNIVAGGGGNVVANDGAGVVLGGVTFANPPSIVAAGGGNIVAAGGGNIVAAGGGNIVAAGGGNIVAAGGGNIVAAGGGNMVEIGTRQIRPVDMPSIVTTLLGMDGASLADAVLQKEIGGNVVANDGAGVKLDPEALNLQNVTSLIGNEGSNIQVGPPPAAPSP